MDELRPKGVECYDSPYLPWLSGAELAVAAEDFPDSCGQHREGETGGIRIKPTNHRPESS